MSDLIRNCSSALFRNGYIRVQTHSTLLGMALPKTSRYARAPIQLRSSIRYVFHIIILEDIPCACRVSAFNAATRLCVHGEEILNITQNRRIQCAANAI